MVQEVVIYNDHIRLDQALKWMGAAATGGEAKLLIAQGWVQVNGAVETRRSHMLSFGDIIQVVGRGTWQLTKGQ